MVCCNVILLSFCRSLPRYSRPWSAEQQSSAAAVRPHGTHEGGTSLGPDPPSFSTTQQVVGDGRCPIVDTWWQTETAGHMITPLPAAWPEKPGSGEGRRGGHA